MGGKARDCLCYRRFISKVEVGHGAITPARMNRRARLYEGGI